MMKRSGTLKSRLAECSRTTTTSLVAPAAPSAASAFNLRIYHNTFYVNTELFCFPLRPAKSFIRSPSFEARECSQLLGEKNSLSLMLLDKVPDRGELEQGTESISAARSPDNTLKQCSVLPYFHILFGQQATVEWHLTFTNSTSPAHKLQKGCQIVRQHGYVVQRSTTQHNVTSSCCHHPVHPVKVENWTF